MISLLLLNFKLLLFTICTSNNVNIYIRTITVYYRPIYNRYRTTFSFSVAHLVRRHQFGLLIVFALLAGWMPCQWTCYLSSADLGAAAVVMKSSAVESAVFEQTAASLLDYWTLSLHADTMIETLMTPGTAMHHWVSSQELNWLVKRHAGMMLSILDWWSWWRHLQQCLLAGWPLICPYHLTVRQQLWRMSGDELYYQIGGRMDAEVHHMVWYAAVDHNSTFSKLGP